MDSKTQKKLDEAHAALVAELEDPEFAPVLRAAFNTIVQDIEAVADALGQMVVDAISDETLEVKEEVDADWADPKVQVDPNVPHPRKKAKAKASAGDPAED